MVLKFIRYIILGNIPSKKNSLRRIMRGRKIFTVPSELHETWHKTAFIKLKREKGEIPTVTVCHQIKIYFWFPDNRRRDLTNIAESVFDLMVDTGVIADDNWKVTGKIFLVPMGIDRENPRAEIEIDPAG